MKTQNTETEKPSLQRAPRKRTFPENMPSIHRRQYVKNLREIRFNEKHGINLEWNERLRDTNAIFVQIYLAPNAPR